MSDQSQNPKSPEQQFAETARVIGLQRRPWQILRDYRDDGIKGKYIGKRPGLQSMLTDIRTGGLNVDAILVDTWERFARAEEAPAIRQDLLNKYGVIILTADSGFTDPTTLAGKALGFVEQIRATTGNEVKAHDVLRAKMELARNKRWPGGPIPFGKKTVPRVVPGSDGNDLVEHDMADDPRCDWIVQKLFASAKSSGMGAPRLAKVLNDDPTIPMDLKPFNASFVAYILDNPIYKGVLRFNAKNTGIVNDSRIQRRNAAEEVLLIDGFCEPLVSAADWDAVQTPRRRRSDAIKAARAANQGDAGEEKQIPALGAGLTLKYLLTGLVCCAECGARMAPCSSTGAGKGGKRYVYYRCPRRGDGSCTNTYYVREDKLLPAVLARVRALLFPKPSPHGNGVFTAPDWLEPLVTDVRAELEVLSAGMPDQRRGLQAEVEGLRQQMKGWMQSLGKVDLPQALRQELERQFNRAADRVQDIETQAHSADEHARNVEDVFDADSAIKVLARLEEVLASANVTEGNFELSLHIERIDVHTDGTIIMRTCKLGAFAGAVELLSTETPATSDLLPGSRYRVKNRLRGRLQAGEENGSILTGSRTATGSGSSDEQRVADPGRFAQLSDKWMWADRLPVERPVTWTKAHGAEVLAMRQADVKRWTLRALAEHFEVSKPTIQKALREATSAAITPTDLEIEGEATPLLDSQRLSAAV